MYRVEGEDSEVMIRYIWNRVVKKLKGKAIRNSVVDKTSKIEAGTTFINSIMDRYSFCGYNCKIINCRIGSFCSIADDVYVGGARHPVEWASTSPVFYKGRDSVKRKFSTFKRNEEPETVIGNDVWIGDQALIKSGINMGDGAVIGMGSVVTKNVGAYEIWAGNPARLIRKRFSDEVIEKLENSKWWDKEDEALEKAALYVRDPERFVKQL